MQRARRRRSAAPSRSTKIANALGVPEDDVVDMNRRLSAAGSPSLNAAVRADGEGEWQDWLVDETPTTRRTALAEREELIGPQVPAGRRA
jgi:RNA polymerase sigma-32 factor